MAWVFVLCVLYSKDKRQSQDSQDKEVQIKYREQKTIPVVRDFLHSSRPAQRANHLLYNGYRVSFAGVKRPKRGVNHPPPSSTEVEERVELHVYSPSRPAWALMTCYRANFTFFHLLGLPY